ncbi:MAG: DUF2812 domain-containing protein [Oscillospiraceae bacterium]|nr:DUF2812 domain-containing protein [Oscillospiraceae bacterium]
MGGKLNTIKRVRKHFLLYDYEKEEQYLHEMHANGWRFVDTTGWRYTFERCEPAQVIYRIDFSGVPLSERDDYNAMFRDYGWEYLQDFNGFSYFRKSADGVKPEDLEIFSDGQSRLDMAKRILTHKLFPLLMLMLLLILPQLIRLIREARSPKAYILDYVLLGLYLLMLILYSVLFLRCFCGYRRMKKKYSAEQ